MEPKEEIKQRIDVVDLIQEYIQMKPAGTHAFKAVCPFHTEKTPSFHVSRDKQIWRCFGCGLGGDIFSFVMQMEGIDFPEAMRLLGKKAGVEVQRYDTSEANEKARCQRVQNFAAAFYRKMLLESPKAIDARAYVERRNIPRELVEKFQLGCAPDEWDAFVALAKSRGISDHDLTSAGLALPRKTGQGVIDRFRHRLMIPLCDVHGNVLGFTGRVLNPDDLPKYMNSPETVLYKKSAVLFGLHLAKQAIRRENAVIIVEGNLDVVASHKAGVEHVVASSGTALTELQIQLLKRFTTKLLFCFDADAAGFAAAQRGIAIAQKLGCDVSVVLIPEGAGKDPDDVVQKQPELWRELVHSTVPIMEYYFTQALKGKDLMKVEDKRAVGNFLLPEIAQLADVIEREHWLQKLGMLLHVETEVLRGEITKGVEGVKSRRVEGKGKENHRQSYHAPQGSKPKKSRRELVAEEVLGLFVEVPEFRGEIQQKLQADILPSPDLRDLYRTATELYTQTQSRPEMAAHASATPSFFEQLRDQQLSLELKNLLERLALKGEQAATNQALTEVRTQLKPMIDFLRQAAQEDERRVVLASIRQAEAAGDRERVKDLMKQLHELR